MKKEIAENVFGSWKSEMKGSSIAYVRRLRKEWKIRSKRLLRG